MSLKMKRKGSERFADEKIRGHGRSLRNGFAIESNFYLKGGLGS